MTKKLFAILLCVAMLATLVVVPAYAEETTSFSQNFTGFAGSSADNDWVELEKNYEYVCPAYSVTGMGGKSVSDTSIRIDRQTWGTNSKAYYRRNHKLYGTSTVEFNFMPNPSLGSYAYFKLKDGSTFITFRDDGKNGTDDYGVFKNYAIPGPTPANRWSRIAVTFDFSEGLYDIYVNGVEAIGDTAIPSDLTEGSLEEFWIQGNHCWIDDIKIYSGTYTAPKLPTLSATNTVIAIDNSANTISMPAYDVTTAASKLTVSDGTFSGVVDGESGETKTSGTLENGDLVAVVATDGVTYSYYTVSLLETYGHSENFETITDTSGTDNNYWHKVASTTNVPNQYIVGGEVFTGVGGKLATDKSLLTHEQYRSDHYYRFDHRLYGRTTLEYTLLKTDTTDVFVGHEGYNQWVNFGKDNKIYSDGSSCNNIVGSYEIGKWYRVAYDMDFGSRKYDAYVNGQRIVTQGDIPSMIVEGAWFQLRFKGNAYFDDVSIYSGSYSDANATLPALTSGTGYTVNEETKVALLDSSVAIADVATVFGSNVTVVDAETHLTKTEGSVETGDLIAVVSEDGHFFNYYTAVIETISNIEILNGETPINTGLVQAGNLTAKVHITATENASYKLYIAKYEGNALTAVSVKDITIAPEDGGYVDADYATEAVEVTNASSENIKAFLWKTDSQSPIKYAELLTEAASSVF